MPPERPRHRAPPSFQEHQAPAPASSASPKDSPAHEVTGGGTYVRFDVPRARTERSWPSCRGEGAPVRVAPGPAGAAF